MIDLYYECLYLDVFFDVHVYGCNCLCVQGERNIALRRHIVDSVHQSYTMAAKDIHNLAVQLQKSHIAIQVNETKSTTYLYLVSLFKPPQTKFFRGYLAMTLSVYLYFYLVHLLLHE